MSLPKNFIAACAATALCAGVEASDKSDKKQDDKDHDNNQPALGKFGQMISNAPKNDLGVSQIPWGKVDKILKDDKIIMDSPKNGPKKLKESDFDEVQNIQKFQNAPKKQMYEEKQNYKEWQMQFNEKGQKISNPSPTMAPVEKGKVLNVKPRVNLAKGIQYKAIAKNLIVQQLKSLKLGEQESSLTGKASENSNQTWQLPGTRNIIRCQSLEQFGEHGPPRAKLRIKTEVTKETKYENSNVFHVKIDTFVNLIPVDLSNHGYDMGIAEFVNDGGETDTNKNKENDEENFDNMAMCPLYPRVEAQSSPLKPSIQVSSLTGPSGPSDSLTTSNSFSMNGPGSAMEGGLGLQSKLKSMFSAYAKKKIEESAKINVNMQMAEWKVRGHSVIESAETNVHLQMAEWKAVLNPGTLTPPPMNLPTAHNNTTVSTIDSTLGGTVGGSSLINSSENISSLITGTQGSQYQSHYNSSSPNSGNTPPNAGSPSNNAQNNASNSSKVQQTKRSFFYSCVRKFLGDTFEMEKIERKEGGATPAKIITSKLKEEEARRLRAEARKRLYERAMQLLKANKPVTINSNTQTGNNNNKNAVKCTDNFHSKIMQRSNFHDASTGSDWTDGQRVDVTCKFDEAYSLQNGGGNSDQELKDEVQVTGKVGKRRFISEVEVSIENCKVVESED